MIPTHLKSENKIQIDIRLLYKSIVTSEDLISCSIMKSKDHVPH